ncbi:rhodanese-like domain-containing protein [Salipaludibacillus sp. HK11]|uniref:rhodanese-like domain-containing protein n=1 Tax=Salipaludibacillus sp. HK11 TaxID=3394320 RepID=UPI0039FDA23C
MKQIDANQVEEQLKDNQKLTIIDVREPVELTTGKIPGAINIPLNLLEFRMHELNRATDYIIVCRSGARSGLATQLLQSHGFEVTNMTGGMMAWEAAVEQESTIQHTSN